MTTPRDIGRVIDAMLAVAPESATGLRAGLERVKLASGFKAPELMRDCWVELLGVLNEEIGEPREDWQKRIADIFSDRVMP